MQRSEITKPERQVIIALVLCCAVLLAVIAVWQLSRERGSATGFGETPKTAGATPALPGKSVADVRRQLEEVGANPETTAGKLRELRSVLMALPSDAAAGVVREVLNSNVDAPTHLDLMPGPGGILEHPSSLRVFLLDCLGEVDAPGAAAEAERVLSRKTSPDEWAVALRNYARVHSSPEGRAFLRQKFEEMIRHDEWRKNPSAGFLQAFDVAVFAGGTELVPTLAELLRQKDNQAVAHASYLALDRMILREPAALLTELQQSPELMRGRELTRANYFARANLSDTQQKAVVEAYLLDPFRVSGNELETFAGLYPNRNLMLSYNLLTTASAPSQPSHAGQDRFALEVIEDWLADARFAKVRPRLERMKARLESFVKR
jgi:hypothetical protein